MRPFLVLVLSLATGCLGAAGRADPADPADPSDSVRPGEPADSEPLPTTDPGTRETAETAETPEIAETAGQDTSPGPHDTGLDRVAFVAGTVFTIPGAFFRGMLSHVSGVAPRSDVVPSDALPAFRLDCFLQFDLIEASVLSNAEVCPDCAFAFEVTARNREDLLSRGGGPPSICPVAFDAFGGLAAVPLALYFSEPAAMLYAQDPTYGTLAPYAHATWDTTSGELDWSIVLYRDPVP